jgi:hypothetical protein
MRTLRVMVGGEGAGRGQTHDLGWVVTVCEVGLLVALLLIGQ